MSPGEGVATAARRPGIFTFSIDLELAWGERHRRPIDVPRLLAARQAFPDLLGALERQRIRATFAVVGHLLLEGCDGRHPELARARGAADTLASDPGSDEARDPLWYAPALVRRLAEAEPGHDVGAHGFSHLPFDGDGVSVEVARDELRESARLLRSRGFSALSFVFPWNRINYTQLLEEQGFACYRGVERRWYRRAPVALRRAAHMLEQGLAVTPPCSSPLRRGRLVELEASMLLLSRQGFRRLLPLPARVARARRGLERAAATGRVFHLWMHAEDLVPQPQRMLAALEQILGQARGMAGAGRIEVKTMADLADPGSRD